MNIIGRWKLKGINIPTENGMMFCTKENIPEEYSDTYTEAESMVLEFLEDGTYNVIQKVEGELAKQAKAEGMEISPDGYAVALSATWEDRNGTIYYDCGAEGTVLDEEVDPFLPLEFTEDGCIWYNYGICLYERV